MSSSTVPPACKREGSNELRFSVAWPLLTFISLSVPLSAANSCPLRYVTTLQLSFPLFSSSVEYVPTISHDSNVTASRQHSHSDATPTRCHLISRHLQQPPPPAPPFPSLKPFACVPFHLLVGKCSFLKSFQFFQPTVQILELTPQLISSWNCTIETLCYKFPLFFQAFFNLCASFVRLFATISKVLQNCEQLLAKRCHCACTCFLPFFHSVSW